ncbi:MAG: [Fe-Fe] hydrogenase large subunit C-terminal domain-containing protein [Spirochaetales bacterium]|nr:[Fe-Fe] hydrogenase large subunit C-terminal domain-containing protein [Spirochaetales bacterium]
MTSDYPLYTEKRECQDCYKCVRHCPVKAISVHEGSALVTHELCIYCGRCYEICPVGAKKIPLQLNKAEQIIRRKKEVFVSLSPSFFSEFSDKKERVFSFLFQKGIKGISETAIGAEFISRAIDELPADENGILISTACPVIVNLVNLYYPELEKNLTPLASPMIVHGRYLREKHGDQIGVIFIGPCIAKKSEALDEKYSIDCALTFEELQEWMEGEPKPLDDTKTYPQDFLEIRAHKASLYPLDGGMIQSLTQEKSEVKYFNISGIDRVRDTLEELKQNIKEEEGTSFFELLSCSGGCINGPARMSDLSYYRKSSSLMDNMKNREPFKLDDTPPLIQDYKKEAPLPIPQFTEEQIEAVLVGLDKRNPEDRLNCGGCGYNSCYDFAVAKLQGKAENAMCAGNMRKQAQKKVNALIKTMPSAVVIVNQSRQIVECNNRFLEYFSELDQLDDPDLAEKAKGLNVENFVSFSPYFMDVLKYKKEKQERLQINGSVFRTTFFTIEKDHLAGAIIEDVTQPSIRRETIITRAEEVIRKNLSSVQQIASLLGENAAETEIILNSVIEELKPPAHGNTNEKLY